MEGRSDEKDEAIPVGRPRPMARTVLRPRRPVASASDAGGALIGITLLLGVAGWGLGHLVGVPIAGAMAGALLGVIAGFAAVYARYRDL